MSESPAMLEAAARGDGGVLRFFDTERPRSGNAYRSSSRAPECSLRSVENLAKNLRDPVVHFD